MPRGTQVSTSSLDRFSPTWLSHSMAPLSRGLRLTTRLVTLLLLDPTTPATPEGGTGLGYCDFARHYFRNRGFFLFLQVLRWFTSLGSLIPDYGFIGLYGVLPPWVSHSEIPGSKPACGSPRLIAACHVLHRLLLPRHPPCALSSLTIKFTRGSGALRQPRSFVAA